MRPSEKLSSFVKDALVAGRGPEDIRRAITEAGWTQAEAEGALATWANTGFTPPVPSPTRLVSARDAFFYGLMFAALLLTTWHLNTLAFELIEAWLPDVDQPGRYFSRNAVRWSVSILVVFAPLFFWMNHRATAATRSDPVLRRSGIRRWFGYVTLFLASITLLCDLVYVIHATLSGDLTAQVAAQASVVAATASAVFFYFRGQTRETDHVA